MAMMGLPNDIIEDILSRLPFKSLKRLKSMSKSCNLLISMDQYFARMHAKRALQSSKSSTSQKILLASPSPGELRSFDLDYEEKGENYSNYGDQGAISRLVFPAETPHNLPFLVVGSCHGLLLIAFENGKDFYLWNPTTGDYNKLPDPCFLPNMLPTDRELRYSFVYGFGYDLFSDDYKVLLGLRILRGWNPKVEEVKVGIFSMRENCWRNIQQLGPAAIKLFKYRGPDNFRVSNLDVVNGTLNWLVINCHKLRDCTVVAFDLKTERFLELPMPDINHVLGDDCALLPGLGVVQGRLCLCVCSSAQHSIELWVMNEGQTWTKLLDYPFQTEHQQYPLCISKDNQIILVDGFEIRLTRFDADGAGETRKYEYTSVLCKCIENHNMFTKIENPTITTAHCQCTAVSYLETLVSPNFNNKF